MQETRDSEFESLGMKNLQSAMAFSALTTPNGACEKALYENIVEIPHYEHKYAGAIFDREDGMEQVEENLGEFQKLYENVINDEFRDLIKIRDGNFYLIGDERNARLGLM